VAEEGEHGGMRRSGQVDVVGGDGEKGGDEYGRGEKADFLSALPQGDDASWLSSRKGVSPIKGLVNQSSG